MRIFIYLILMGFVFSSNAQVLTGTYGNQKIIIKKIDNQLFSLRIVMASHNPNNCADPDLIGKIKITNKKGYYIGSVKSEGSFFENDEPIKVAITSYKQAINIKCDYGSDICLRNGKYFKD